MQNNPSSLILLCISVIVFTACGENQSQEPAQSSSQGRIIDYTDSLSILDPNGREIVALQIAIADNEATRSLGLMDVRELKAYGGMLFIFENEERQNFWMANTPLPLDLMFANKEGEIVHIHQRAQPFSRDGIDSIYPALYVLEVNAGFALNHDIQIGHTISYTR